jgi:ferredoxin
VDQECSVTSIAVDRIRCDGHGLCAGLLPELIRLDEWGYPIIQPGGVPLELLQLARRAVVQCPVQALRLTAGDHRAFSPIAGERRRFSPTA